MKTRLPFSTISYNTPRFLALKLNEFVSARIVTFWTFIEHKPEDDEAGKKQHCHLWVVPARSIQTDDFLAEFKELDPSHPDKPFKCLSARSSKSFGDWYLYAIHDAAYLISKGQSRRYKYAYDEFITSDVDDFHRFVSEIDMLESSPYRRLVEAMNEGITFEEFFRRGGVPIQQVRQFEYSWNLLVSNKTERAGKEGHE